MTEHKEDNKDRITLQPDFYEKGGMTRSKIAEARDIYLRSSIAPKRGLPPDASWNDINSKEAENARKMAATKLNLNENSSWGEIVAEFRKRFEVKSIVHTPLIF